MDISALYPAGTFVFRVNAGITGTRNLLPPEFCGLKTFPARLDADMKSANQQGRMFAGKRWNRRGLRADIKTAYQQGRTFAGKRWNPPVQGTDSEI